MKKTAIVFLVVVLMVTSAAASPSDSGKVQAERVQFPILIDGKPIPEDIPRVTIIGSTYLPARAMCEYLGYDIIWKEPERTVEINTQNKDKPIDLEITKETAIAIADAIFLQKYGSQFMNETIIGIRETDDKRSYVVYRYIELMLGGSITLVISKKDGRVTDIVFGE